MGLSVLTTRTSHGATALCYADISRLGHCVTLFVFLGMPQSVFNLLAQHHSISHLCHIPDRHVLCCVEDHHGRHGKYQAQGLINFQVFHGCNRERYPKRKTMDYRCHASMGLVFQLTAKG